MLIQTLLNEPVFFFLWVIAVVLSLSLHEFSHALAGHLQGDPTAESAGRLTLNPLAHIDWLGFILLLVAGFGWAKPTPFNPYNLRWQRIGPIIVALAGPLSNIALITVIGVALRFLVNAAELDPNNLLMVFFVLLIQVNVLLAVFNFIPIPPLDGSRVLTSLAQDRYPQVVVFLDRYGMWLLLGLVFLGGNFISSLFQYFYQLTLRLIF